MIIYVGRKGKMGLCRLRCTCTSACEVIYLSRNSVDIEMHSINDLMLVAPVRTDKKSRHLTANLQL